MPHTSPYLQYLNKLNNSPMQITSVQQLSDGLYMHDIMSGLKQYQNAYPYDIIPEPLTFVHRMKNIKSLIKAIHQFWSNHVSQDVCYQIDVIKIAKENSTKEIQKLIRLLVKTLFQAKHKHYFIEKVLQTSQETQQFFMDLVKEQTSVEFTSPKSSKSTKNYNDSLYDKLLELQHQNQHLMRLVEQLASQSYEHGQKQKQFEQKVTQKEAEIRRLNWALNEANQKKFKPEDSDLSVSRQRFMDEMMNEKFREVEERQKLAIAELQRCKQLIRSQSLEVRQLKRREFELQSQKQQNLVLKQQVSILSQQIKGLKQTKQFTQSQINSLKLQSVTYQSRITLLEKQLSTKLQQIQQLQRNIRFLTQQKEQSFLLRQNGSSMKQECRQMSQPVIVRKKRETDKVNKQLRSALLTISKQEKQIEKLRIYEQENKKLVQMISHMHKYRGEENQVLVNCLYKMRVQLLEKDMAKNISGSQNNRQKRNPLAEITFND